MTGHQRSHCSPGSQAGWRAPYLGGLLGTWQSQKSRLLLKVPMVDWLSGWWFQTFVIFHFIYGMSSFPTNILQRASNHQPGVFFNQCFLVKSPNLWTSWIRSCLTKSALFSGASHVGAARSGASSGAPSKGAVVTITATELRWLRDVWWGSHHLFG